MTNTEFDPEKGPFGIGNGINEYNDQEDRAKADKPARRQRAADTDYAEMTVEDLHKLASERNIEGRSALTTKDDLVAALKKADRKG